MRHEVLALLKSGQPALACARLVPALSAAEPDPELLKLGINAALMLDDLDQAWQWFHKLRAQSPTLEPNLARVGSKLANRLGARHEQQERGWSALLAYDEALALWPDNPDARANLIRMATQLADVPRLRALSGPSTELPTLTRAVLDVTRAAAPVPAIDSPQSLTDWQRLAEQSEPEQEFPAAVDLQSRIAAHLSLPMVYRSQADVLAWRQRYQRGLQRLCADTPVPTANREGLKQLVWSNFYLAYQGEDDRSLQVQYGHWLSRMAAALRPELAAARRPAQRLRPRVGLISGHWYQSTVGSYFASWIAALADAPVQLEVLALEPNIDAFSTAIVPAGVHLQRLPADPDRSAEWLHAQQFDLLIYPELGIDTRLLPMAALPLADQQWSAWGHPVTPGLPTLSRYLSVASMEPPEACLHYQEPLSLLSGIGTAYRAPAPILPCTRQTLGLPEGRLLVCPQSPFKIHPDQDRLFAETLAAIPNSRLLLFAAERPVALAKLRHRLTQQFAACDIDPKRLIVHPMVSRPRFLELLSVADLMLDTGHWSGGNTALDALFVGLPMVATEGRFMRGRQSAAMLRLAGLDAAIAPGADQYAATARALIDADRQPWRQAFAAVQSDHGALAELVELVRTGLV